MIFIQCLIQTDTPFLVACFSSSVGSHKTDPQKREDSFPIIACLVESRKGKRGAGSQANGPGGNDMGLLISVLHFPGLGRST